MDINVPSLKVELSPHKRKRNRKNKRASNKVMNDNVPPGQVQIMTAGQGIPSLIKRANKVNRNRNKNIPPSPSKLPDYSTGWLERHLDPCGEYRTALDYGKIPDGTLPQSASGQFREVFTIRAPGLSTNQVPLDGGMWSLLILSTPLWRTPFVLVADLNNSEVGNEAMKAAFSKLNGSGDYIESYPVWTETTTSGVYVSVVRWKALSGALAPSSLGVSPLISDFRITGDGFTVSHNTPSLINQGIAVVAQFNPNVESRDIDLSSEGGSTNISAAVASSAFSNVGVTRATVVLPGIGQYPWRFGTDLVRPPVGGITFSGVLGTAGADFTTSDGSVQWATGDSIRLQLARTTATDLISVQRSSDLTTWSDTDIVLGVGASAEIVGVLGESVSHSQRVNVVTSPPVTQEDLIQMTPKTVQFLLKESKGFYVVKRAWQPVFGMTRASSYGPIRFIDFDTDVSEISGLVGGLEDTADANYGFAVCNLSSLPLACAPYVKAIRSWEVVPSRNSVFGPFTTTTSPKDDAVITVAKTISDIDPFAYPHNYNGLGILFRKVVRIVCAIPKILRTGANIADGVASVCQGAQDVATSISQARESRRDAAREGILS